MWLLDKIKKPKLPDDNNQEQPSNVVPANKRELSEEKIIVNIPLVNLTALGAGIASLLPTMRTVTQTVTQNTDGLFRLVNAGVGDTLKIARNGNYWGALKTSAGVSKMAQFQSVNPISTVTNTTLPINPTMLLMVAMLYKIDQKLDEIKAQTQKILNFLEIEKESEIEADIETLSAIFAKYKYNWENEQFVESNYKSALDIQRTARKNIISYARYVSEALSKRNLLVSQTQVNKKLNELLKLFKYYRMSIYVFAMSSLAELILGGDFREENIEMAKDELTKISEKYGEMYGLSVSALEGLSESSVKINILKGLGSTSRTVGKAIGQIPVISRGQLDEFLSDKGQKMRDDALDIEQQTTEAFAQIRDLGIDRYTELMENIISIYNRTSDIYFDDNEIYLVGQ